jgi:hypothetical protein
MSKLILTASLLAVLAIAACSPAASGPSAVPSVPPSPSTPPSMEPPASDPPVVPAPTPAPTDAPTRPAPDPTDPPDKPDPAIVEFTDGEIYLSDGILRGVMDCEPVRNELPKDAVAGIECIGDDPAVARVGYYLFENDDEMLDHYFARLAKEGVERDMGDCYNNEGEGAYIPGEEEVASRYGCFITAEGVANYRMTLPGAHVYIGIVGRDGNPGELLDFAFLGNRDTPSFPTLWGNPNS